jgi:Na+/melibiose symporter-like transporter
VSVRKLFLKSIDINEDFLLKVKLFLGLLNLSSFLPNLNKFLVITLLAVYFLLSETAQLAHVAWAMSELVLSFSNIESVEVVLVFLTVFLFGVDILLSFNRFLVA